jgi:hypothetical protein
VAAPRGRTTLRSFWSAGPGWGSFSLAPRRFAIAVTEGSFPVRTVEVTLAAAPSRVTLAGAAVAHDFAKGVVTLKQDVVVKAGQELAIEA